MSGVIMRRLIKKSESINSHDNVDISPVAEDTRSMQNMTQLDELSEADVRHDRCPICDYNPLKRDNGFKICPKCETIFKNLDGDAFMITK